MWQAIQQQLIQFLPFCTSYRVILTKGFQVLDLYQKQLTSENEILWNTAIAIAIAQGTTSTAVKHSAHQHFAMHKQKVLPAFSWYKC